MQPAIQQFLSGKKNRNWLMPFFLMTWVHMLYLSFPYFQAGFEGKYLSVNSLFHFTAWPFYAMLYLLPAFAVILFCRKALPRFQPFLQLLALILTSVTLLYIWTDRLIFNLYTFHINSFVLNLVMTEGGIDSLNSSDSTFLTIAWVVGKIVFIQIVFMAAARRLRFSSPLRVIKPVPVSAFFVLLFLVQGVSYGVSDIKNNPAVLDHAYDYPFFQKVRFRSLAGKLGIESASRSHAIAYRDNSRLHYPLNPVTFSEVSKPPNIVWLVAESLRWDQLSPEVMPNTWRFAGQSQHFLNHYSSGNGTREGMFGMFYGLYGSYWNSFMHARQSPLLMDRLQQLNYDFDIRTGAKFTYPEFDKTILAKLPDVDLHEADPDLSPWQRDDENTSELVDFIAHHDTGNPFMAFQFFESTHAPYFFPDDSAIKTPYLDTVNYAELSKNYLNDNVGLLLARYRNAGHWVDVQLGKIFATLEAQNLLDNTIVIITGDHGEEFMEKGSWGHNSSFVEEQTHVPFVMWMPGMEPKQMTQLTSHLDIATTLLQQLGADAHTENYSLGMNLFTTKPRDYINISDWHSIAVVTDKMKIRIPYISTGLDNWSPTDEKDKSLDSQQARTMMNRYQRTITSAIENTSLFTKAN